MTSVERIKAVPRAASILAAKGDARCGNTGSEWCRSKDVKYECWGVVVDLGQSMGPGCETRKSVWSDVESDVRRSMARARWAILIF